MDYDTGTREAASIRLPRAAVEHVVIEALLVELEIGTDGTLLVTTPDTHEPLATASRLRSWP